MRDELLRLKLKRLEERIAALEGKAPTVALGITEGDRMQNLANSVAHGYQDVPQWWSPKWNW